MSFGLQVRDSEGDIQFESSTRKYITVKGEVKLPAFVATNIVSIHGTYTIPDKPPAGSKLFVTFAVTDSPLKADINGQVISFSRGYLEKGNQIQVLPLHIIWGHYR